MPFSGSGKHATGLLKRWRHGEAGRCFQGHHGDTLMQERASWPPALRSSPEPVASTPCQGGQGPPWQWKATLPLPREDDGKNKPSRPKERGKEQPSARGSDTFFQRQAHVLKWG